jgi:hypothetical protein
MSNNQQTMKLYTEEQVRMLDINCGNSTLDEVIGCLTPIELPSATGGLNQNDNDKELFYQKQVMNPYNTGENTYTAYEKGFIEGWYKAKQTYGGNK